MFIVDLNEQARTIQVKTNDETNPKIVACGNFDVDVPDRFVLILFNHVHIAPDHHEELDQLLSSVFTKVGQLTPSSKCLRLPAIFDGRIDTEKLKFRTTEPVFMSVTLDHLKYYPEEDLQDKEEDYQFITEKESMLNHAEELHKMMIREAFWATERGVPETRDRINSATHVMMIVDRRTNLPCGFGRLFLLRTNEELFGYLSDVVIDSPHQLKVSVGF